MPQAKYYCDYCEREFNDTMITRKKHMQSKAHKLSVKYWYDSFKGNNHSFSHTLTGIVYRFEGNYFGRNTKTSVHEFTENWLL